MNRISANFDFLEKHDEQLVRLGALAERYFKEDPNTCLIKLRQFGEVLAQLTTAKAGLLQHFPIYYLRATFASRLSAVGVPDTFVAQMLGHSTTSILPSYAKAIDEYRRDAIRKLDELRKTEVATTSPGPPTSPTIN